MCPRHSKTGPARDPTMGSQPLPKLCHLALRSMFDISGPNWIQWTMELRIFSTPKNGDMNFHRIFNG